MKRRRLILAGLLLLAITGAAAVVLLSSGAFNAPLYRQVRPGHQEIVFLAPATSGDAWERFIAAIDTLHNEARQNPGKLQLRVDTQRAFPEQTADVPEVGLWIEGAEHAVLWIRWYKLSGGNSTEDWVGRLTKRSPPPLAFIGGDTSFRARELAEALKEHHNQGHWQGASPVLLITTATADRFIPGNLLNADTTELRWPLLMNIYKDHSFRFSFTNTRMAEVVLHFVRTHDELWLKALPKEVTWASIVANRNPWAQCCVLTSQEKFTGYTLHVVKWNDDSYSWDLADRFFNLFAATQRWPRTITSHQVLYSVGDVDQPNPSEQVALRQLVTDVIEARDTRQLLLLPTGNERARRLLNTLLRNTTRRDVKNLVVITGDSLSFNNVYRDHEALWNIRDLPVPLVIFSHRDPIDETVGFRKLGAGAALDKSTGTTDLLLNRDILEAVLLAAYGRGHLVESAEPFRHALRYLTWSGDRVRIPWKELSEQRSLRSAGLLFDALGNRSNDTGEHVIVVRPGTLPSATIKVWRLHGDPQQHASWKQVGLPLPVARETRPVGAD